jgi:hypothetical protein
VSVVVPWFLVLAVAIDCDATGWHLHQFFLSYRGSVSVGVNKNSPQHCQLLWKILL